MNQRPTTGLSRRQFVATAAAASAAVSIVPRHVLGGAKFVAPSEKVNIAIIGCGGQGRTNMQGGLFPLEDAQVIAMADPAEETNLEPFYYKGKGGRKTLKASAEKKYSEKTPNYKVADYADFREMLDKEKAIDAVLVATPDHNHAFCSITAMKMGKHCFCEKPLTHNVNECRTVARVAKETGVATQMGNHGHSGEGLRATAEYIWDGAIGKIKEVHAWSDTGNWVKHFGRPTEKPPVPAGFDWNLWLGVRPERDYSPEYHPYNWRGWWAFGGGAIGDMAPHNIDPAVYALKLEHPTAIEATTTRVDSEVVSPGSLITYRFPARGEMPPVTLHWYDGGLRPPTPLEFDIDPNDTKQRLGGGGNGIYFVGEKGVITCDGWAGMPRLLPLSLNRDYKRPEKTIPRVKGHHADWIQACKGGPQSSANFEYSAKLIEIILLGGVALRTTQKDRRAVMQWDGPNMKSTNTPEAEKYIMGTYRKGWELPA
jgi:predicted dehydrogenase